MPDDLPVSPPTPSADVSSVPSTPTEVNTPPPAPDTPAPTPPPVEPAVTIPEPVVTNEPSIIPPAQPESVPTPLPENPPVPVPEEPKRKGISGTLVASLLLLLIVLPISAYFVSKNENIMSNLPFATREQKLEALEAAAQARAGGAITKIGAPSAVGGPIDSGITHQCNGTAQTIPDFVISSCPQSGQDCTGSSYIYHVHADTTSNLKLTYVTRSTHCSNVSVLFKVDDTLKYTTGYISGSVSTGAIDLGNVEAGDHTVSLGAIGQTGGCNAGFLISWGGSITTTCGEAVVTPTPTVTATPTSTPSQPGVCDASCDNDSGCSSGFVCVSVDGIKRCRKPECSSYANCVCPAVTATPIPTSLPRVIVTATPTATATPAPTIIAAAPIPKTPVSGVPSVLGAATIGGGILLLLLGLLL